MSSGLFPPAIKKVPDGCTLLRTQQWPCDVSSTTLICNVLLSCMQPLFLQSLKPFLPASALHIASTLCEHLSTSDVEAQLSLDGGREIPKCKDLGMADLVCCMQWTALDIHIQVGAAEAAAAVSSSEAFACLLPLFISCLHHPQKKDAAAANA